MERVTMNCKDCQSALPDLLLDPGSASAAHAKSHLTGCPACAEELNSLRATFDLLDAWEVPEPSAWFDQRLAIRLRQEQASAPEGWFERIKSRLLFNTGRQLRPALAGALTLTLLLGGGTAASVFGVLGTKHTVVSATVQDLQILDRNDQTFQAMDLLQDDGPADDGASDSPTS